MCANETVITNIYPELNSVVWTQHRQPRRPTTYPLVHTACMWRKNISMISNFPSNKAIPVMNLPFISKYLSNCIFIPRSNEVVGGDLKTSFIRPSFRASVCPCTQLLQGISMICVLVSSVTSGLSSRCAFAVGQWHYLLPVTVVRNWSDRVVFSWITNQALVSW